MVCVAPARERGLKYNLLILYLYNNSRSREGAWIEIGRKLQRCNGARVAPARERGLKWYWW